jgi:hypothetical protein
MRVSGQVHTATRSHVLLASGLVAYLAIGFMKGTFQALVGKAGLRRCLGPQSHSSSGLGCGRRLSNRWRRILRYGQYSIQEALVWIFTVKEWVGLSARLEPRCEIKASGENAS